MKKLQAKQLTTNSKQGFLRLTNKLLVLRTDCSIDLNQALSSCNSKLCAYVETVQNYI